MSLFIPRITIEPMMRPSVNDPDVEVPISDIQLLDTKNHQNIELLYHWGRMVGLNNSLTTMQSRLERAQGALQKIADAMLRDGWGLYPTSEEGISHRLTFGYTDPTPLGYQRPYTTVLIPTQVQSLLGAFNDPKESWTTIFAQEMYRAAYHTVGLLSEIVFILMVCCPGLIAFRYRLEDHPLTMNKSMVIFVPPNSWLQRRADVLSHIVGEHSAARFLSLSQSQTYMIDQA